LNARANGDFFCCPEICKLNSKKEKEEKETQQQTAIGGFENHLKLKRKGLQQRS